MNTPSPFPPRSTAASIGLHALIGAVVVGGISFSAGFFGPIFLQPDSPQGPMLGIFVTGPAGFILGLIGGAITGWVRSRRAK